MFGCMKVDSAGIGKRETDLRLTPGGSAPRSKASKRRWADDITWKDVPWFRSITKMPLVLKGVQCGSDAVAAYRHGLDGIVVSNHGGRNMDTARPSLEALVEVMAALRMEKYSRARFQVCLFVTLLDCSRLRTFLCGACRDTVGGPERFQAIHDGSMDTHCTIDIKVALSARFSMLAD
jgi:hypothetical protein